MAWGPKDHSVALLIDSAHSWASQIYNSKCHSTCHHLNFANSVTTFSPISSSLEESHLSKSHHRSTGGAEGQRVGVRVGSEMPALRTALLGV